MLDVKTLFLSFFLAAADAFEHFFILRNEIDLRGSLEVFKVIFRYTEIAAESKMLGKVLLLIFKMKMKMALHI